MYVFHIDSIAEQRSYFGRTESGNAAAYFGDEECQFGMLAGEADEFVHIGLDAVGTSVHGRDAIGLSLQAGALTPDGSPLFQASSAAPPPWWPSRLLPKTNISPGCNSVMRDDVILPFMAIVFKGVAYFMPRAL